MKFLNAKNTLVLTIILITVLVVFIEPSRFVLFLGRFHPVILHLPIGALILTLFIDIVGRVKKNYPHSIIRYALGFSSFFAILTCLLGYFLSFEGGYDLSALNNHLWLGTISTILIVGLFLLSKIKNKWGTRLFLPCFIIVFAGIILTGHYGSILTHGSDFLTQYAKAPPKAKIITEIDSLKIYNDVVHKIFDTKCTQCHNTTKRKGELALNTSENILKGGENGAVIEKGNAEASLMFKNITLPLSDENHMPPEGKPQLTKDEIWLIKYWINQNADFKNQMVHLPKNDTLIKFLKKYLVFEEIKIKEASISDINEAKAAGFIVFKLVPNKPQLSVKYPKKELDENALKILEKLRNQIVELDLSNTNLTDAMTVYFKKFKTLRKLSLNNTKITDNALKNIKNIKSLKTLNVYNTKVTENGLNELLELVNLEHIYIWNSSVSKASIAQLESTYNTKLYAGVDDGFIEITHLEAPTFLSNKNLFMDTMSVKFISKIKNVNTYYTLNGTEPDSTSFKYEDKIVLDAPVELRAISYKKGWLPSEITKRDFFKVKHEVSNYKLVHQPDDRYPGSAKLFDLIEGSERFRDGNWIGFSGDNVNVTIDLESIIPIDKISVNCLENVSNWIFFPKKISVYSSSEMNLEFKKIGELKITRTGRYGNGTEIKKYTVDIPNTKTQYLRVVVENFKTLPSWHEGAGTDAWLFVDEILIR